MEFDGQIVRIDLNRSQEGSSRGAVGTFRRAHFDVDPRAERGGRCGLEPGASAPPDETRRGRLFVVLETCGWPQKPMIWEWLGMVYS